MAHSHKILEENKHGETPSSNKDMKSFVKTLCKGACFQHPSVEITHNESTEHSRFLIMYLLSKGCENIDSIISELDGLYPNLINERTTCQCKLFRSPNAVSMTSPFIKGTLSYQLLFLEFINS